MKQIREFVCGFKQGTGLFGHTISTLINSALLTVVYVVGVGLTAAAARAKGKQFLQLPLIWDKLEFRLKLTIDQFVD